MFDYYELRARIIPAAVVASPGVLPFLAFGVDAPGGWMWATGATTVLLVITYIFSFVVRYLGKHIEESLWESWGGPPSSIVLTVTDTMFPIRTKSEIKTALNTIYQLNLTDVENGRDEWTKQLYETFRLVKQYLRQHDPKGIWHVHNAEYGALRNLFGASLLWFFISGVVVLLCLYAAYTRRGSLEIALSIVAVTYMVVILCARKWVLPRLVREKAFQYAASAWLCFLNVAKTKGEN